MQRPTPRPARLRAVALVLLGLGALLLAGELLGRLLEPPPRDVYVWKPRLVATFRPQPAIMPGVEGVSRFRINSLGLRGDEPSSDDDYRILAVGGSTTECMYLDQEEAWPQVLQARLRAASGLRVWVANAGRSGHTTREHVLQVERLLQREPRFDALLVMAGVNDLCKRLSQDQGYDPQFLSRPGAREQLLTAAFDVLPDGPGSPLPRYKQTALWRLASRLRARLVPDPRVQRTTGEVYTAWRAKRAGASALRDELPDLSAGLEEFRSNLTTCVRTAKAAGVRVVLLDQPALWRDDLPPELLGLLWLGGVGDYTSLPSTEYYTAAALARGMARYNEVVHQVARDEGVESIALAERLARDGSVFYDDVHYTEEGARQVAAAVAEHLLARGPFGAGDPPR